MKKQLVYGAIFIIALGIGLIITEKMVSGIPGTLCTCVDEVAVSEECYGACGGYDRCVAFNISHPGWCTSTLLDWCCHTVTNWCKSANGNYVPVRGYTYDYNCSQCPGNPWGI